MAKSLNFCNLFFRKKKADAKKRKRNLTLCPFGKSGIEGKKGMYPFKGNKHLSLAQQEIMAAQKAVFPSFKIEDFKRAFMVSCILCFTHTNYIIPYTTLLKIRDKGYYPFENQGYYPQGQRATGISYYASEGIKMYFYLFSCARFLFLFFLHAKRKKTNKKGIIVITMQALLAL